MSVFNSTEKSKIFIGIENLQNSTKIVPFVNKNPVSLIPATGKYWFQMIDDSRFVTNQTVKINDSYVTSKSEILTGCETDQIKIATGIK